MLGGRHFQKKIDKKKAKKEKKKHDQQQQQPDSHKKKKEHKAVVWAGDTNNNINDDNNNSAPIKQKKKRNMFRGSDGDALLEQFRTKLDSSTFRYINEQVYSSPNAFASQLLSNAEAFGDYHAGYQRQLAQWPVNPNDVILQALLENKKGRFVENTAMAAAGAIDKNWVVCDMGCGEAPIAKVLAAKGYGRVHSFDFCAVNAHVTVADMSKVPLPGASVDVVIFCLSLMATDYYRYLVEAHRILKTKRLLKIVEVRSRLPRPDQFAAMVEAVGFRCEWYGVIANYFVAFDFSKKDQRPNEEPAFDPAQMLLPCLYKRR